MKKVIIKRSKWSRGDQANNALLVGTKTAATGSLSDPAPRVGTMCCLGFVCKARGATNEQIRDRSLPGSVPKTLVGLNDGTVGASKFCVVAATINDDPKIKDSTRESRLKKLAAKNGFNFVFVP